MMNLWMNAFEKYLYSTWEYVLLKGKSVPLHIMEACAVLEV
jgi:hypothetical protein